jgi:hypothetical protein
MPRGQAGAIGSQSSGGRVLEFTRAGEIVWQFVNPVRGGAQNAQLPIVCWAQRLDANTLDPTLVARGPFGPRKNNVSEKKAGRFRTGPSVASDRV